MSIIKLAKGQRKAVESIHRATLQDNNISWEAQGLLTYLLSLPDEWQLHVRELSQRRAGAGVEKMRKILKELEDNGYITSVQVRDKKGRLSTIERTVYERPVAISPDETTHGKTGHGKTVHGKTGHGKSATREDTSLEKTQTRKDTTKSDSTSESAKRTNPDVLGLLQILNEWIQRNGFKAFNEGAEAYDAMSRLMTIDGRNFDQIAFIIDWSQTDEFWLGNIRSPKKLREHFDTMLAQALRKSGARAVHQFINSEEEAF